ncbi:hypothetical protein C8R43DRAFT_206735 [Mycena crocata]|nr:hypothetical protein C8R43DRAFT_206735 [Mycena crocata]
MALFTDTMTSFNAEMCSSSPAMCGGLPYTGEACGILEPGGRACLRWPESCQIPAGFTILHLKSIDHPVSKVFLDPSDFFLASRTERQVPPHTLVASPLVYLGSKLGKFVFGKEGKVLSFAMVNSHSPGLCHDQFDSLARICITFKSVHRRCNFPGNCLTGPCRHEATTVDPHTPTHLHIARRRVRCLWDLRNTQNPARRHHRPLVRSI